MDPIVIEKSIKSKIINYINNTSVVYTNLYLIGSRVWGFYSTNSDYDIFIETTETHDTIRTEISTVRVDLKFYSKEQIFAPYLDRYDLPRFSILDGKFYNVDNKKIIDWIYHRFQTPAYLSRHPIPRQWHYDTFNISDKINLPS
jgi:predicted nucleotidyltransferase